MRKKKTESIVCMLSHMDLWIHVLQRKVNPSVLYSPWVFCTDIFLYSYHSSA